MYRRDILRNPEKNEENLVFIRQNYPGAGRCAMIYVRILKKKE
jgi:hypothetical protein